MLWPVGPYETMMVVILSLTIPLQRLLTRDEPEMRLPLRGLPDEIRAKSYQWHIAMYALMYLFKAFIDQHNEAIKPRVGGFTHLVYEFEGEVTLWVQESFKDGVLTDLLSFHYLFVYLFLIWFSPMYYILCRDEVMADKAVLNDLVIYVWAVHFYLFFFTEVDPLDNGIPSLHVGIPISLLIINRLHVRDLGISISEWRHREFDLFVAVNVPIYLFSIQYLGIHWLLDLVPGLLLAVVCAVFSHRMQPVLRAVPENGWASLVPDRAVSIAVAASALVGAVVLAAVVIDGPGTDSSEPTMRLGPGDVNLDVIEIHSLWDPVVVEVSNVGDEVVEVLVIHRDSVREHANDGAIDWSAFSDEGIVSLGAGESWQGEVDTPSVFDGHYVLVSHQGNSGVGEVRVSIDYVDDALIWSALLCSVPSFAIIGWVLGELRRDSQEVMGEEST